MARKNLLAGLMTPKLPAGNSTENVSAERAVDLNRSHRFGSPAGRGAIGAVTRSIEGLKSSAAQAEEMRATLAAGQTVVEIDPNLLDPSPVADRIVDERAPASELIGLIRDAGQQVPILARPHPEAPGRYQIAYGHRRVAAAKALERPVRAVVRALSDAELVVAQGQENSARRDLSFIERALYAAKLEEAGFDRETIMAALNVDKTGLSRLITAAVKIPRDIVEAIGPAPKIGRDRWLELAGRLEAEKAALAARVATGEDGFAESDTDARFEIVLKAAEAPRPKAKSPPGRSLTTHEGRGIGRIERAGKGARLVLSEAAFAEFLARQMSSLYEAFGREAEETSPSPASGGKEATDVPRATSSRRARQGGRTEEDANQET